MHKTLHKKLTDKHFYHLTPTAHQWQDDLLFHETSMLREAAKDLLKPRPEAIANLLKMVREQ